GQRRAPPARRSGAAPLRGVGGSAPPGVRHGPTRIDGVGPDRPGSPSASPPRPLHPHPIAGSVVRAHDGGRGCSARVRGDPAHRARGADLRSLILSGSRSNLIGPAGPVVPASGGRIVVPIGGEVTV